MEKRILIYRKYMFMYGILSLLFVLEYLEINEKYEECEIIIKSIKQQEKRLNCVLFTKINKQSIEDVIETYKKFNLTGVNAVENSKYYSGLIIKELSETYKKEV